MHSRLRAFDTSATGQASTSIAPPVSISHAVLDPEEMTHCIGHLHSQCRPHLEELVDPRELFGKHYFLPIVRVEGEESMLNRWGPPSIYSTMK